MYGAGSGGDAFNAEGIATLLAMARQRIREGNPSLALKAVVMALRATGGEQAVLQALSRARELHESGRRAESATDELSALFAEFALAESVTHPLEAQAEHTAQDTEMEAMQINDEGRGVHPILAESGRLQVVVDASSDGSSFVCRQCGGLVSNLRRDEHVAFWCSPHS